ncbi:hypothetical protein SynPROS91_01394 [Synechococcus sp. PROS-9-1]|nr:hypothetical protein SynPROS91_01394 [Synechococcus sp. PROS-9-1]
MPVMRQSYGNTTALHTIFVPAVQLISVASRRKSSPGD